MVLLRRYTKRIASNASHGPADVAWEEEVLPISCLPEPPCCCANRRGLAYDSQAWLQKPSARLAGVKGSGQEVEPRTHTYAFKEKHMWGVRVLLDGPEAEGIRQVAWYIQAGLLGEAGEFEHRVEGERGGRIVACSR